MSWRSKVTWGPLVRMLLSGLTDTHTHTGPTVQSGPLGDKLSILLLGKNVPFVELDVPVTPSLPA